ncbi:MAG TPA: type IIL restriction-modification enzyme MmeI, partial [Solirubrobacterales bacterium]
MVRPSRNDIREAARAFAHEWEGETRERGEAQSFWTDFLLMFGIQRRRVNAAFERHARRTSTGGGGFIDLLWPGMLLAEHKSAGEDLDEALDQALDYIEGLDEQDMPRLIVVSDFARVKVLDLEAEPREAFEFPLGELPREVDRFLVLAGYTSLKFETEDAVNVKAAELLGKVYDEIAATGYPDHSLRIFIVRVLFLLFGDDTGLWPR